MDSACYNVNIILYRSLHGVKPPNLRKLFLLKWREAEKLSSPRVRLRIFRAREVEPCLLYHHQHRLISIIQTRQKIGMNLSKHGKLVR